MENKNSKTILYKNESYTIQGAIFEVYRELGSGFLESVYQECLEREFQLRNIPFERQKDLNIIYKGEQIDQVFRVDFVCYENILIELKAVKDFTDDHRAQIMNYLKISGFRLGLLVNFGHYPHVAIERFVL